MKRQLFIGFLTLVAVFTTSQLAAQTKLRDNQTFLLTKVSKDKTYGYSETNPIKVGGVDKLEGPLNERRFINALAGPNGEAISYYREGSCCPMESENSPFGVAYMDKYRVTWEGAKDTVSIYINMYDYDELRVPVGFTMKK